MSKRQNDFPPKVRDTVAARVGYLCSRCTKATRGPKKDPLGALNLGVAAHITAASPGGARYDVSLTPEQRRSIDNAIWLCQKCSVLIDRDKTEFTEKLLRELKANAENRASIELGVASAFRAIDASEILEDLSVGERALLKALADEFGCRIETNVRLRAGDGWLRVDGAVVRDEDLVAIEMYELRHNALPYFQVEYLVKLCSTLKFERFKKAVLYIAVVSDQPKEIDEQARERLEEIKAASTCEFSILMYRLHALRAKYQL